MHDRKIIYTYNSDFGGKQLTEEIMRHYGLTFEEAGKAKKEGGLPGNYKVEILDPFIDDMAQTVNRSLQFFLSSTSEYSASRPDPGVRRLRRHPRRRGTHQREDGHAGGDRQPLRQMKMSSRAKTQLTRGRSAAGRLRPGLAELRLIWHA